ncbi:MAG TPA: bifunctional phosphopantothenoylcysteine decarboxylase/phosphopantothenate--cysteine ligase CoaBC [Gammaproteobacteria bacterium]|jgi:phosphopantothenoylcysteine decarboxylase/phosphopantothenate--cysteine ligase|nr:bifunctional phosphopantothenoylcysteine decarboxylase/phosphopantothenate--cysteine ligase CoaBC [Gammaproteobacteria bacterium]
MASFLANKRVLLGITGSIAAYKSADLTRRLREAGAVVRVAMTENAKRFITPLTMQAVSGHPVHEDLFDLHAEAAMGHIELARWADVVIIAPATADCMVRLANGNADDLLTTLCLATKAPIMLAPAMNQGMWQHTLTQENLQALKQRQIQIIGPTAGSQACGDVGLGRMAEPLTIIEQLNAHFATGQLAGCHIVVTAGPTQEAIDPIRFLTNRSSGKMGYALAEAAHEAGAQVTLISGPVSLLKPRHFPCLEVISTQEMYDTVMKNMPSCDIFLAVAAVSDYRSQTVVPQKIHKQAETLQLALTRTPDIVTAVAHLSPPAKRPFVVGFAAETENVLEQARIKRQQKNMDMIIANQVAAGIGMESDDNTVTVISSTDTVMLPLTDKRKLARILIELIAKEYHNQ